MKVAIIGAGINGLYIARKLAEKDHKITVFEKNIEIGNKVCSGLFSARILDFIPESEKLVEKKIFSALIHFPKKTIKINFSKEFLLINHSELNKLADSLAKKRGVEIIFNKSISEIPADYDRIIGCDGHNSIIRKKLKLPEPKLHLGIQCFADIISNEVETWPTKNGFIWKIPRKNKTEYGIIEKVESAKKLFNNSMVQRLELSEVKSKIIPQGLIIPKNKNITLCGDAAGLTKPWSGGGVIWGLIAADILINTFPDFSAYRKRVLKFFLPKIIVGKMAVKIGYFVGFNASYLLPKNIKIESDYLL